MKPALWTIGSLSIFFIVYCSMLFREVTSLMNDERESRPSIVYSDLYTFKKGELFSNTFLKERLNDLKLNVTDTEEGLRFKTRRTDYPESLIPTDSNLRIPSNAVVAIVLKDDRINTIMVDGKERDALSLEPTPIARFSASGTTIRDYLPLSSIPTKLAQAIIAIEDQRFLEHYGFDPRSFFRAMFVNLRSGSMAQGGSTLTMQLIKNLLGTRQKTFWRKGKEIVLALLLEARYTKEEILEKYMNEIYFGQIGALEVHGVSEAARYFFNKQVNQLSTAEIALIAGVIRGPAYYSPYKNKKRAIERRDTVIKKMAELTIITQREMKNALSEKPTFAPPMTGINKAPYFVDYVKAQILEELGEKITAEDLSNQALKIYTTLDIPLQRRADESVYKNVIELEGRYKIQRPLRLEGLLVSAETGTGFVRALVGGRSYSETTYNRVLNMKRQVGSSFKPISYLAAFIKGSDTSGKPYTPAYMVDDEPWTYEYDKDKSWTVHNYEKSFRGHITLFEGFINSINVPMAKIATDVGIPRIAELAEDLGITTKLPHVPALTLGAVELSAMELLQVYSTFANDGEKVDLTTVRAVVDANGAVLAKFSPASIQVVEKKFTDVLNGLLHAVTVEGTAKIMPQLGFTKYAYGKTGTTNFYRDSWFSGFSQNLTTITWVGFDELQVPDEDDEKALKKYKSPAQLTGASGALPIWASYYKNAFPSKTDATEEKHNSSVERVKINRKTGCPADSSVPIEDTFDTIFISGTSPSC